MSIVVESYFRDATEEQLQEAVGRRQPAPQRLGTIAAGSSYIESEALEIAGTESFDTVRAWLPYAARIGDTMALRVWGRALDILRTEQERRA